MQIPFNKPFVVGKEMEYIRQVVEGDRFAGNGELSRYYANLQSSYCKAILS